MLDEPREPPEGVGDEGPGEGEDGEVSAEAFDAGPNERDEVGHAHAEGKVDQPAAEHVEEPGEEGRDDPGHGAHDG